MRLVLNIFAFFVLSSSVLCSPFENINNVFNEQNQDNISLDIQALEDDLKNVSHELADSQNAWIKQYHNLKNYNDLSDEIAYIEMQIANNMADTKLRQSFQTLKQQRDLLPISASNPYEQLLQNTQVTQTPEITNPFLIFRGWSYIRSLLEFKENALENEKILQEAIDLVIYQYELAQTLLVINEQELIQAKDLQEDQYLQDSKMLELKNQDANYSSLILESIAMLESLESAQKILNTANDIYAKHIDDIINEVNLDIKDQVFKLIYILAALVVVSLVLFGFKMALRKYMDPKRLYIGSKIINFLNIAIICLVLLFAYMENVTYLVAILGFASAGMAIAMKDLFMSLLGWFVIFVGGSIHVGDRIKVVKDGAIYVGDVLDISALRITIYEDITWTSYSHNHRAGRIIFIPNNYVFTHLLANYTHAGLKSVWDVIDITITFDSNHKKALKIATTIGQKYSKGYTENTKNRMEHLKDKFSLRDMNLQTRAFSIIEPNGVRISLWYHTNSYATMALKSTISADLVEAFLKESDIHISYPTTRIIATKEDDLGDGAGNKFSNFDVKSNFGHTNNIESLKL